MSGVPETSRSSCTAKHGPIEVGLFEVRRVGHIVALTLGTPQGEFLFLVPERRFVRRARGIEDGNGNRWRSFEEIEAERLRVEEPAPPAAPAAPSFRSAHDPRRLSDEREQLYIAAFIAWKNTRGAKSMAAVASENQLPVNAWTQWCYKNRARCEAAWAESRPPVLKPKGSLV